MSMWKKNQEEPVILTLSSDEEEEEESPASNKNKSHNENIDCQLQNQTTFSEPINPKEPIIKPNSNYENYQRHHNNMPDVSYEKQLMLQNANDIVISIQCRYLRIGSYKVIPNNNCITISYKGIEVQVPPFAEGDKKPVTLLFEMKGILKVLAHLGQSLPVLFIYMTDPMAADIRNELKMTDKNGFYFDPCSQEESQKRVTILPEKIKVEMVNIIKNLLNIDMRDVRNGDRTKLFEELSQKDANEILVKSSPGEVDSIIQSSKTPASYETKTLVVFPPPPNKGGISITMDDYLCLKDEQFLNDVLIDFYLKWLHMSHISERDRERTHMFSTFFYKRLTAKPKATRRSLCSEDVPWLSPSQRRHSRVKSWTKNVDIFTKDFLLIPINEHAHWFLAVICFPNLNGPIQIRDGKPVPKSEATLSVRSSTRQKKKVEIPVIDDGEWSDRDEAEGDDNELSFDDADSLYADEEEQPPRKRLREQAEPIKQPCILIFDSLSGEPRSRIVATLRDYLAEEHLHRKGIAKEFSKDTMQGACPKVPQQMNFSDCGLFTLQFAQSFFERPLKDFRIPVQSLADWFDQDVVGNKRVDIANLIQSLMDQHKPNHCFTLPPIHSNFSSGTTSASKGGSSSPTLANDNDSQDQDYLPHQMIMSKAESAAAAKSKTEQLKSFHISKKCSDTPPSDSKRNSVSVITRTNRSSPQRNDEDNKPTSVASSVKHLSNFSCDRQKSSPKSGNDFSDRLSDTRCRSENGTPSKSQSSSHNDSSRKTHSRDKANCSSSKSKKVVDPLQLLRDSYGGINNDIDDEIFLVNCSKSPKSELTSEKRSPTINFSPLSRITR